MAEDRVVDIRLSNLTKRFDDVVAVDDLSLEIERGRFFALLGPSGCGKTTTLRMIGGFEEPTSGRIELGDRDVAALPPYKRDVNTVFQSYALFPHLTVFENVAFGLRRQKVRGEELQTRVREALELVGLGVLANRKPRQLSGGQQQRIALARALVNHPRVLLLDEPLGALDLKLRKEMQLELKRIQHEVGITFVHVTHDQEEAMTMADEIVIMHDGRIEQQGSPTQLYEQPRTAFVAGFLGVSNLLYGTVVGDGPRAARGRRRGARPARRARRAHGQGADRGPAREAAARRRRGEFALRHRCRERVHRRLDAVHRRDAGRRSHRLRPERPTGRERRLARRPAHRRLEPGLHIRRRCPGGFVMSDRYTRAGFLRRAAAGGTVLTVPGLLAACGGGGGRGGTTAAAAKTLPKTIVFSNWPLYIDINEKTKKHPSLEQFQKKYGVKVKLHRGHQRQRQRSSGRSRGRSRRASPSGATSSSSPTASGLPAA